MRSDSTLLDFSNKIFKQFLKIYPLQHHDRFNEEMAQDFRDLCEEVLRKQGLRGFLNLWIGVGLDLIKTAFEEQFKVRTNLTLEKLVRVGAVSAILSGVVSILLAFTHASPNWIQWTFRLKWIWLLLGGLNLLALLGYAAQNVIHEKNIGIGYWVSLLGATFITITGIFMPSDFQIWRLYSYGIDILALGFLVQSISGFLNKSSLGWNVICVALGIFMLTFNQLTPPRHIGFLFTWDATLFAILMGMAWIIFGLILLREYGQGKQVYQ
jgi:hypothetical protein